MTEESRQMEHNETINDFVVTEEFTGEDTELLTIMVEHEQYMHNLSIAMMRAEHRSVIEEEVVIYEQAREGFFNRAWDQIKKFWARVVAFFQALWKRVVDLFIDREKWVRNNEKAIDAGAGNASMNMPEHFANWNGLKRVDDITKELDTKLVEVSLLANVAQKHAKEGQEGRSSSVVNSYLGRVVGKTSGEAVNWSEEYRKIIGELKEINLKGIIEKAKKEVRVSGIAKRSLARIVGNERRILAQARKMQQGSEYRSAALRALNKVSTETALANKALHNTIIQMANYGWQACRKAAGSANLKEETNHDILPVYG